MWNQRSGLFRAVLVALVPPILVGVVLLLIEYNVFQRDNGDAPTATSGSTNPPTATRPPNGLPTATPSGPGLPEPSITLSTASGPPGTELTISGGGFAAGETIVLRFHTEEVGRVQANGQGSFSGFGVQVPDDWPFTGQFDFIASGQTSIRSATMPFEVT